MSRLKESRVCISCTNSFKPHYSSSGKYCSNSCQKDYEYAAYVAAWLSGDREGHSGKTLQVSGYIRRYLIENYGTACSLCGWDEKHPEDGLTLTEIDHIDGDASNNRLENLRVLCPNCHSMTPTFRARNKSSRRVRKT